MDFGTPLNPKDYSWRQPSIDPSTWQRPMLASECTWTQRPPSIREIFICGSLTLKSPISRRTFTNCLQHAWRLLRFKIPELGLRISTHETGGNALLQYHAIDDEEAQRWVIRTLSCQSGNHKLDFEALRRSLLAAKQDNGFDHAFLLSGMISREGIELLTHTQIMICIDHQIADGIGARIILGMFFDILAIVLETPESTETNEHQLTSGPEYEVRAAANRGTILDKMKHNPGLPLLHTSLPAKQETYFLTLTKEQTSALLRAIKQIIGPTSNITHLGHAAMVLVLLPRIPSSLPSCSALYSPCWLNGRRYLRPTETQPEPSKSYVPICQSFAPIVFQDLEELVLSPEAGKEEVRRVLSRACRVATDEYGMIKERRSMMGECVVLFEDLGRNMTKTKQNVTGQDIVTATQEKEPSDTSIQTADPFFLSDGITEQYISHSYPSLGLDNTRQPFFTVHDIQFAAHAEKNLIVRMSSWSNQTTISGEWRSCEYDRDMVVAFLEDVVGIMMSIVD